MARQAIYDSLVARVHRLAYRIVGAAEADDVSQQVFVRLFESLNSFRGEAEFTTWVYRLAVNESLQHLRRNRRRQRELIETPEARETVGSDLERQELLTVALAKLAPEWRIILELKEIQQMPYAQIAAILGIPEGTVGSRLNAARRELRSILMDLGWES